VRVCSACDERFAAPEWRCPRCGQEPPEIDGVVCLAPDLADGDVGFDVSLFAELAALEGANFWFRARNRLIEWALRRHFSDASRFLEVGCGTGFVLAGVRQALPEAELHASELHLAGLRFARERHPHVRFYQLDARSLPFDAEFDVIGAFDLLEHIDDDVGVLEQLFRAVRPGGGVVLTVPQHPFLWSSADDQARHARRYRVGELQEKLLRVGFRPLMNTSFVTLLLPLMMVSRYFRKPTGDPFRELRLGGVPNRLLEAVLGVERGLIRVGVPVPCGGTRVVAAARP
jgi:SAM-dependent methyltransferase